jgi:hypothetical protein
MAARRIDHSAGAAAPARSPVPQDHPWRVVLLVLLALVVVLGVAAIGVVAASSGLVSDVWDAMTSVFRQP